MPSTTTYSRGQVVVVNVPFTAQLGRLHPEDLARVAQGLEAFGL